MLHFASNWLIGGLLKIAEFLGWREFVVAFFVMAFAGAIPNMFLGISSALSKIPELSFGDVIGGNVIDLTIVVAIAVFVAGGIPAKSKTIQTTSIFTMIAGFLPMILILDGNLGRIDGIILIMYFIFYVIWLFSKKERFERIYRKDNILPKKTETLGLKDFSIFIRSIGKLLLGLIFLLLATQGIVKSALFFSEKLYLPLALVGLLVVGLGNALPETYFSISCAKKGQTYMILGNLMGSVILSATLVLGTVAIICPIHVVNFSSLMIGRIFLILASLFFFFFVRTDRKITKKEAFILLGIYCAFILVEILMK